MTTKNELRETVRAACAAKSGRWLDEASRQITALLETREAFRRAGTVALYWSLGHEVATHGLIRRWYRDKAILLPVMEGERLHWKPFTGEECLAGARFGIREPQGGPAADPAAIDLAVVPGMGFDRLGNRLGHGKGFYDRFLLQTGAVKIGLCFDFQLLEAVPAEAHDVPMDRLIVGSESGASLLRCR